MIRQMPRLVILAAGLVLMPRAVHAQLPATGAAGPAGSVTISRPEYDRLLDLASRQPRPPEAAPIAGALTRADIRARVGAGVVRATMQVEGEVFRTGPAKVPLVAGATLIEARMAKRASAAHHRRQRARRGDHRSFDLSATLEWVPR